MLPSPSKTGHNDGQPSFATTFSPTATASHLAPGSLSLGRIQRAWERKPRSPFSKRRFRVGKVWKRTTQLGGASSHASSTLSTNRVGIRPSSPMKAVKKMRGEDGNAHVLNWDVRGSPGARRIVTRAGARETEEVLEELSEDAGDAGNDHAEIELQDENGLPLATNGEEPEGEWEEVEELNDEADFDETLVHLGDAVDHTQAVQPAQDPKSVEKDQDQSAFAMETGITLGDDIVVDPELQEKGQVGRTANDATQTTNDQDLAISSALQANIETISASLHKEVVLPDGFVSPVKERRRRPISQVRQSYANRRRTLPENFIAVEAPVPHIAVDPVLSESASLEAAATTSPSPKEPSEGEPTTLPAEPEVTMIGMDDEQAENIQDDAEWEDVEHQEIDMEPDTDRTPSLLSPSRLLSSPVPSILGQHPRLPLRRSPRRQSTSPLRRSVSNAAMDGSHLVAFTPIKLPGSSLPEFPRALPQSPPVTDDVMSEPSGGSDDATIVNSPIAASPFSLQPGFPQLAQGVKLPMLERCSSAPPEEPQMSPQKPRQPRISDDTALLQAFLKRADENKVSRNMSVSKRESLENQRESDAVRSALASPGERPVPNDVLAELDPNSPSPRKQTIAASLLEASGKIDESSARQVSPLGNVESLQSPLAGQQNRRSRRTRKKTQVLPDTGVSAPSKISIKGSADAVVLKKTEAQELVALTKQNTNKNKIGAVMPYLRKEQANLENGHDVATDIEPTRARLRWAETLTSVCEFECTSDLEALGEEMEGVQAATAANDVDQEIDGHSYAVPASETPSKPRIRRLRPPKPTASIPARTTRRNDATAAMAAEHPTDEPEKETQPPPRKRQSRIATPAKPKASTLDAAEQEPALAAKKSAAKPVTKKKPPMASKLPAPVSSAFLSTGYAPAGKEGSHSATPTYTIASPPKKRTRAAAETNSAAEVESRPPPMLFPRIDIAKTLGVSPSEVPGLASPAKKGRKAAGSGTAGVAGEGGGEAKRSEELMPPPPPPSLGSPAKKRARRL